MPFKSEAQRRYFEANKSKLERQGGGRGGVGAGKQRYETSWIKKKKAHAK